MSKYYSKNELCEVLGVSIGKVDLMMGDGLKYVKFGRNVRFRDIDVEEYMGNRLINN